MSQRRGRGKKEKKKEITYLGHDLDVIVRPQRSKVRGDDKHLNRHLERNACCKSNERIVITRLLKPVVYGIEDLLHFFVCNHGVEDNAPALPTDAAQCETPKAGCVPGLHDCRRFGSENFKTHSVISFSNWGAGLNASHDCSRNTGSGGGV
jgi:hypothetical protein